GYSGDDGQATSAQIYAPWNAAVDRTDTYLYIADRDNNKIRRVNLSSGIITHVATTSSPAGIGFDSGGNVYIASSNDIIQKIDPVTLEIITVAGILGNGGYSGDTGPATSAQIDAPFGIAVDSHDHIYFPEFSNHVARKLIPSAIRISGTPTNDNVGDHAVTIEVDDGISTDSQSFTITVINVNTPPEIAVIPRQTIYVNAEGASMSFTATDDVTAGCDLSITYTTSDLSLLSVNNISYTCSAGTYYLLLTPTTDQSGAVSITLTLSDGENLSATRTFTVIVSPPGAGNALSFDGTDDVVEVPASSLYETDYSTFEFWVKPQDNVNEDSIIIGLRTETNNCRFNLNMNVAANQIGLWNDVNFRTISYPLTPGRWYHLALVDDGTSSAKLYINGVQYAYPIEINTVPTNQTLIIGGMQGRTEYFSGSIDEVRIWNTNLSQEQIRENMCKRLTGEESNLVAYFRFDNTTGTKLVDLSGNDNHGTLLTMDNSDWVTSGAALGDDSAYDYVGSVITDFSASIAHSDGDQFTATGDGGTYTGIHVYLVNESPNTTTIPDGYTSMDTDHYYGVFPIGTSPTYSVAYNYSGNTYALDDSNLQMAYRANNAGTWTGFASTQYTSTTTLVKTGIAAFSGISATEFILGKNEAPEISALIVTEIISGYFHTLALKNDGTVWAWGYNNYGQLGDGTTTDKSSPIQVPGMDNVIELATGYDHNLALKNDGTVWAWGLNDYGQLGDGTTTNRTSPVQISGLSNVIQLAAGKYHSLALKNDGTVWTWGYNSNGQLGDGTTTNRNSPIQLSGLINVTALEGGCYFSLALKNDGTVWGLGTNDYGQLGDGTTTSRNTPVQVSGLNNVIALSGGDKSACALKSDGTVWAWGINTYGQLGDGTTTDRNTPVQVLTVNNITMLSTKFDHTHALKSDGTLWGWGRNTDGQLGDGSSTHRTSPVQISGLNNILTLNNGAFHGVAINTYNIIWAWGYNSKGQVGDGTTTNRNTPVLIDFGESGMLTTNEDTGITKTFIATDAESSACDLSIAMASSDLNLFTDNHFTYTCSANSYIISITPEQDLSGFATITIITTDAGGLTASDSFSVTVVSVNDVPVITSESTLIVNEDSTASFTLTATDAESADCSMDITFASSNTTLMPIENISYTCAS
ncbi:MAG: hypothetical protein OMM_10587, partial [Candidatus Magnetoglobus multicellularis str. Araruama]